MGYFVGRFGLVLLIFGSSACGMFHDFVWGEDYEPYEGYATIEDFVVGADYELVSVDGAPPERQKHGQLVTVVPVARIREGTHVLAVRTSDLRSPNNDREIVEITVLVQKNGRYRLIEEKGLPTLIDLAPVPGK
ncbi:MAG: hypothetical protein ACOYXU_14985 [Nitrospirota bacterium]